MGQQILHHTFANGLTLVGEPMPWLESIAVMATLPAGCMYDPTDRLGLSNLTCEMVQRGCGTRDSREFIEALEFHGIDFSSSVTSLHTSYGMAMPAESLTSGFPILADVIQAPHLPEDQLLDGKRVCLQEIYALLDDLPQQVMNELRRRRYPDPFGRSSSGDEAGIEHSTVADIRDFFTTHYRPNETILAIAGKFHWDEVVSQVESSFGAWPTQAAPELLTTARLGGTHHIDFDSQQTHIGLSYDTIPYKHEDYFLARGAVGVLSDGMSSRLFTEVREKRGLCYTVYAAYHSLREQGSVVCYSGTSTDRAQETLDVLVAELFQLQQGITREELDRLKVQIRSGLVMQQESSRARAASIAGDFYHLGFARTLDETNQIIQGLTVEQINDYLAAHPPHHFTLVTLGAEPLETPVAISSSTSG